MADAPIMTARDLLEYRWRHTGAPRIDAPSAAIICYQREPLAHLIKHYRATRVNGFFGEYRVLSINRKSIGVIQPIGPGAPIAAMVLEELIAFGVRRFISIGLAGGLQPDLRVGDVIVCDRALRAEGTSDHYLPPEERVTADSDLLQQLSTGLSQRGLASRTGASWTTDAPYREMRSEVQQRRESGVLTVDMEAAAFLSVAQHWKVPAAAIFVVSDNLSDLVWQPADDTHVLNQRLDSVAECVAEVLSTD
jgi:uridine phosphorylase